MNIRQILSKLLCHLKKSLTEPTKYSIYGELNTPQEELEEWDFIGDFFKKFQKKGKTQQAGKKPSEK